MSVAPRFVVLGSGRQGSAAAYDLALRSAPCEIVLCDASAERARSAVDWLERTLALADERRDGETSRVVISAAAVGASSPAALASALRGASAAINALPYQFGLDVARAAIAAGCSLCDLGGHTGITLRQLELDEAGRRAGVALVPDCGQAPGMATSLMVLATGMVEKPEELDIWDGGLPLDPRPPLGYRLVFSVQGLTNEYDGACVNIRDGKVVEFESLSHEQTVEFPAPLGRLEAFCASGTASTFPWTWEGRLRSFTSRIVRYPGHLSAIRTLRDLGFFSESPVAVGDTSVSPRRVTEKLLERALTGEGPHRDVVVVRVHCTGQSAGKPVRAEVDLLVSADERAGLSAMQRATGFDAAIVAAMLAKGEIPPGAHRRELAVDPGRYVDALALRGMQVERRVIELPARGRFPR